MCFGSLKDQKKSFRKHGSDSNQEFGFASPDFRVKGQSGGGNILFARLFFLVVLFACRSPSMNPEDGSVSTSDSAQKDDEVELVAVEPPSFNCPDGWHRTDDQVSYCVPWIADSECEPGFVRFPGERSCHRLGTSCPADGWPQDVPDSTRFVDTQALPRGDGSKTAPFSSIGEAMQFARPGTTIALRTGIYEEEVRLKREVTLLGACVEQTTIASPTFDLYSGTITIVGENASIRNVSIRGERAGIWVDSHSVELHAVEIMQAKKYGLLAAFGSVVGSDVVVRGTRSDDRGRFGYGITLPEEGRLELSRFVVEGNHGVGVDGSKNSSLVLHDGVVRNTESHFEGRSGFGLGLREGTEATLERVLFERNRASGIDVRDATTTLKMKTVVIRETRPRESDGILGGGISIQGGQVDAHEFTMVENHYFGVKIQGPSDVSLHDVLIANTHPILGSGVGVHIQNESTLSLSRAEIRHSYDFGILARSGAVVRLQDTRVEEVRSEALTGEFGRGVEINTGAELHASRLEIVRARDGALVLFDSDSAAIVEDLAIRDTRERECECEGNKSGVGVAISGGASLHARRFFLSESPLAGVQLLNGDLDLQHGVIADNPIGINIQQEGFELSRISSNVLFRNNGRNISYDYVERPEPNNPL